jgi:hemerythrin-like domain-containing protein
MVATMTTTLPFDESTRPRAPKPADAAVSADGRRRQQTLVAIHEHLRHELRLVTRAVEAAAAGDLDPGAARAAIAASTLRRNYEFAGSFCAQYCRLLTMHHTIETRHLFPAIGAGDPTLRPVVERLDHEHDAIHELLVGLDALLVTMTTDATGASEVATGIRRLEAALDSHLRYEESELLGPIGRLPIPL